MGFFTGSKCGGIDYGFNMNPTVVCPESVWEIARRPTSDSPNDLDIESLEVSVKWTSELLQTVGTIRPFAQVAFQTLERMGIDSNRDLNLTLRQTRRDVAAEPEFIRLFSLHSGRNYILSELKVFSYDPQLIIWPIDTIMITNTSKEWSKGTPELTLTGIYSLASLKVINKWLLLELGKVLIFIIPRLSLLLMCKVFLLMDTIRFVTMMIPYIIIPVTVILFLILLHGLYYNQCNEWIKVFYTLPHTSPSVLQLYTYIYYKSNIYIKG